MAAAEVVALFNVAEEGQSPRQTQRPCVIRRWRGWHTCRRQRRRSSRCPAGRRRRPRGL